ncbi:unnamed protein product [Adineta ricciae]|uniref:Costars domain-containing protein n=1 Tax=Adineta ricciae TaxID=249248 RepID=A0A814IKF2_ADIRI|nr:unnamed protein product [Adineta ricciae]CAF1335429.1 unnamed protein product [Adineta ricciae]
MASSNKDNSIEYDKQMYKKPERPKNHLAGRLNKFQETINQTQAPSAPAIQSIHDQHEIPTNVMSDIKHVFQLIKDNGLQGDYAVQIKFGEFIPIFGDSQVNKLVEILAVARQHGFINYSGNGPLQQDQDEEVYLKLIKTPY